MPNPLRVSYAAANASGGEAGLLPFLPITLTLSASYPYPIAIKAARPVLAASNIYKSTAFKKIGSLPSQIGFIDITALYQTRFRVPGPGYKIALELMGVAPGGYHTAGLFVFGIINDPTAQAMVSDPNSMDNDAPALLKLG